MCYKAYADRLNKALTKTQIERDEAKVKLDRLERCYKDDHDHIVNAKLLRLQVADQRAEIDQLKEKLSKAIEQLQQKQLIDIQS